MLRNVILLVENCYGSKILKKDTVLSYNSLGTFSAKKIMLTCICKCYVSLSLLTQHILKIVI